MRRQLIAALAVTMVSLSATGCGRDRTPTDAERDAGFTKLEVELALDPWQGADRLSDARVARLRAASERKAEKDKAEITAKERAFLERLAEDEEPNAIDVSLGDRLKNAMTLQSCVGRQRGSRQVRCTVKVAPGQRFRGWELDVSASRVDARLDRDDWVFDSVELPGALVSAPDLMTGMSEILFVVPSGTTNVYLSYRGD